MLRSGTAGPWLLLLCGLACGDRVVVARGVSLVSAAQSADDTGIGQPEPPEPEDAGADAADGAVQKPSVDVEHGSPGRRPPPPPTPHGDGRVDPHDKDVKPNSTDAPQETAEQDAGHDSSLKRH